jgi:hypothetical protein
MIMMRRNFLRTLLTAGGMVFAGGAGYAYHSTVVDVTRERLVLSDLKSGLRLVAVSDTHLPSFYCSVENLVELINQESPDVFILAGDAINRGRDEHMVGALQAVNARFAKLATLGNWEYHGHVDLSRLNEEYEKAGFWLLKNEIVNIFGVAVIGLDDFLEGSPDYQLFENKGIQEVPLLVVTHCPESFDSICALSPKPTVVISGHTHGGQIAPFGIVILTPRGSGRYVQGWYRRRRHSMYVMRGIGTSGIPLRMGARPEILVLDLLPARA